jgi:pyruvate-ferredoxin/flavodoxin oxidoreductase
MSDRTILSMDGNTAAAYTAHAMNEICAIYPITPSSVMGELADEYSAKGRKNIFDTIPRVYEMQSEGGASGAIHGALAAGCLATTFTASQGLLLMIPNMYKIAGELLPTVFHVSARSLSAQALSIFGDHQDVMACRETGWALVAANNPQEVMDLSVISQATTLKSRIPFLNFFDGFRTSHEIRKVEVVDFDVMKKMVNNDLVEGIRKRALNPDTPYLKGTAQNPDIYFQSMEARNLYYKQVVGFFQESCKEFAEMTGREYAPFQYYGDAEAETVIAIMGSGADITAETVDYLNANGQKTGVLKVRLYRPFETELFLEAMPKSVKRVIVMDRTKEPGAPGEPMYLDISNAFGYGMQQGMWTGDRPYIVGGRYGLSSKEFTPSMIKAVVDHMEQTPKQDIKHGFTVGINDDVTHLSIPVKEQIDAEDPSCRRAKFYGLGSDGTVGANKNSIKVIGDNSEKYVQGYFVYDSKKAGGTTVSHLRFSDAPIRGSYLIDKPDFVAIHNQEFLGKYDLLAGIVANGTVLLNTTVSADEAFGTFPKNEQQTIIDKKLKLYIIDAHAIANELGLPGRINTTMQAAYFKITQILTDDVYQPAIEGAIKKTYGNKGDKVVSSNIDAFQRGLDGFQEVTVPAATVSEGPSTQALVPTKQDADIAHILTDVIEPVMRMEGDNIPVSKMPVDGVFPPGTTKYEKRNIAVTLPKWAEENCILCNFCVLVCPHTAILAKINDKNAIQDDDYVTIPAKGIKGVTDDDVYRIQVSPDDCTGCGVCVTMCPGKKGNSALDMVPKADVIENQRKTYQEYLRLPNTRDELTSVKNIKQVELRQPLFEFSGACPGCGETPYIKLITQMVGDHMIQANATGCSSIFGGTAPTIPYTRNEKGRGPAWASSLFEDNAEYGLGMRLAVNKLHDSAFSLREKVLAGSNGQVKELLEKIGTPEAQLADAEVFEASRDAASALKSVLSNEGAEGELKRVTDYLFRKEIFIVGGDGWAYDIGYGGLDHVLASGENVNVIVLDSEVYSNTGGQKSKATFMGQIAKFAYSGKESNKKDLGLMAMGYKNVYVASINMNADPNHSLKAIREAIEYDGPSLVLAYANCIEHGIKMDQGPEYSKVADKAGYWLRYRYDPRVADEGKNPLQLDSKTPKVSFEEFAMTQRRWSRLMDQDPDSAKNMFDKAATFLDERWKHYEKLASDA